MTVEQNEKESRAVEEPTSELVFWIGGLLVKCSTCWSVIARFFVWGI